MSIVPFSRFVAFVGLVVVVSVSLLEDCVAFDLGNGSGSWKMSSSSSDSSSSLGFSSGSRDPVVILIRGLECSRNLVGGMSRFACTKVFPFLGMSTDIVGCFDT